MASDGPAADRVVDKIEEFAAELANATTAAQLLLDRYSAYLTRSSSVQ